MRVRKYFVIPHNKARIIKVDAELHALVKLYAQERGLSMAEMLNLLIGPAVAASLGGDYMIPLRDGGFLPPEKRTHATNSEI